MNRVFVLILFMSTAFGQGSSRSTSTAMMPVGAKVFVQTNDRDCDSDRFHGRLVRYLAAKGLVPVDKAAEAQFVFRADFKTMLRDVKSIDSVLKIAFLERAASKPADAETTWPGSPMTQASPYMVDSVVEQVKHYGPQVQSVNLSNVAGISKDELTDRLTAAGYKLSDKLHADLSLDVSTREVPHPIKEDVAQYQFEVISKSGKSVASGEGEKTDSGVYVDPIDVVGAAARQIANSVSILR